MHPANFPARKDGRRQRAIVRFGCPSDADDASMTADQRNDLADRTALNLRADARAVRTKKARGPSAR